MNTSNNRINFIGLKVILILFISVYFGSIILVQGYEQEWHFMQSSSIKKLNENYILPFFEQNWNMFAPNPPDGKRVIAVQFYSKYKGKKTDSTAVLNLHDKVSNQNKKVFFSLNQRLIKYFSDCYNNVSKEAERYKNKKELEKNSSGLKSLKNYARFVLIHQKDFLKRTPYNDSIFCSFYFIHYPLHKIGSSKTPKGYYKKIDNILLCLKEDDLKQNATKQ